MPWATVSRTAPGAPARVKHFGTREAEQGAAYEQQKIYVLPVLDAPQVTRNRSVKVHLESFQQMIHAPCHRGVRILPVGSGGKFLPDPHLTAEYPRKRIPVAVPGHTTGWNSL